MFSYFSFGTLDGIRTHKNSDFESVGCAVYISHKGISWYDEWDSNPHLYGHNVLNVAGLPIPCTIVYFGPPGGSRTRKNLVSKTSSCAVYISHRGNNLKFV